MTNWWLRSVGLIQWTSLMMLRLRVYFCYKLYTVTTSWNIHLRWNSPAFIFYRANICTKFSVAVCFSMLPTADKIQKIRSHSSYTPFSCLWVPHIRLIDSVQVMKRRFQCESYTSLFKLHYWALNGWMRFNAQRTVTKIITVPVYILTYAQTFRTKNSLCLKGF